MINPMNFTCPYCGRPTTITEPNYFETGEEIDIATSQIGRVGYAVEAITCPNNECSQLYLKFKLIKAANSDTNFSYRPGEVKNEWRLLPESEAKVLPGYIPEAIKNDYYESCRIRDLSPKASATLSRRCLQGMIRGFWDIKKDRLIDEIIELEEKLDPLVWESVDAVRSLGNIGAHMEKDINLIIDVDPKEAQLLIELIEQLIEEWYVQRHEKENKLNRIKALAEIKKQEKLGV